MPTLHVCRVIQALFCQDAAVYDLGLELLQRFSRLFCVKPACPDGRYVPLLRAFNTCPGVTRFTQSPAPGTPETAGHLCRPRGFSPAWRRRRNSRGAPPPIRRRFAATLPNQHPASSFQTLPSRTSSGTGKRLPPAQSGGRRGVSGRPRGGLGGSPLEKSLGSPSGREGVLEEALPSLFARLSNEEKLPRIALAWRKVITADPTGRGMMGWEVLVDGRGSRWWRVSGRWG